jgi:Fe-S cluster assembly protein SufD
MELKEKLVSSFLAFEEEYTGSNDDLHKIRNQAIKDFETIGFPNRKQEDYKYTSLKSILKEDYSLFPKQENTLEYKDIKKYFIHEIDTYDLVFINR